MTIGNLLSIQKRDANQIWYVGTVDVVKKLVGDNQAAEVADEIKDEGKEETAKQE